MTIFWHILKKYMTIFSHILKKYIHHIVSYTEKVYGVFLVYNSNLFFVVCSGEDSLVQKIIVNPAIDLYKYVKYWQFLNATKNGPGDFDPEQMKMLFLWTLITPKEHLFNLNYSSLPQLLEDFEEFSPIQIQREFALEPYSEITTFTNNIEKYYWTPAFINYCYEYVFGELLFDVDADEHVKEQKLQKLATKMFSVYQNVISSAIHFWKMFLSKIPISYNIIDGQLRDKAYQIAMQRVAESQNHGSKSEACRNWQNKMSVIMIPPIPLGCSKDLSFQLNQHNAEFTSHAGINMVLLILQLRLEYQCKISQERMLIFTI